MMPSGRDAWWARWSIWTIASALLTSLVVGNAFFQKKQFYPTVVYITKSKPSMAVMYGQGLLFVVMMGKLFRKLFFGQLRAAEFEHLVERSWYAVTETCLAFTVFRDDFSPKFLALFTLLLFLKSFHWLAEERVDYMERSPVITWLFHIRVLSLLFLLFGLDLYFVNVAYQFTLTKGASVQLVFGFEYAILTTIVLNTFAKYIFHVIDMQNEAPWDNKAVFVLHTEVLIGFFKVILYILFVVIMVRIYTLPLFALRPTYLALRSFKKAMNDVIMSRRAINNMNSLYPDVTAEELAATDNVCIICREEMTGGAKKLPCNHIFHISCLRSWFQRQQTCPTCRLNVLRVQIPSAPQPPRNMPEFNQFGFGQGPVFQGAPGVHPMMGMWGGIPPWAQAQGVPEPVAGVVPGERPFGAQDAPSNQVRADRAPAQDTSTSGVSVSPNGGDSSSPAYGDVPPGTQSHYSLPQQNAFQGSHYSAGVNTSRFPNSSEQSPYSINIPPMPFIPIVPPPPSLLHVTSLSDTELRALEGSTREHLEAQLQCLRNIQLLLDSATVQMQQYSTVVPRR